MHFAIVSTITLNCTLSFQFFFHKQRSCPRKKNCKLIGKLELLNSIPESTVYIERKGLKPVHLCKNIHVPLFIIYCSVFLKKEYIYMVYFNNTGTYAAYCAVSLS